MGFTGALEPYEEDTPKVRKETYSSYIYKGMYSVFVVSSIYLLSSKSLLSVRFAGALEPEEEDAPRVRKETYSSYIYKGMCTLYL